MRTPRLAYNFTTSFITGPRSISVVVFFWSAILGQSHVIKPPPMDFLRPVTAAELQPTVIEPGPMTIWSEVQSTRTHRGRKPTLEDARYLSRQMSWFELEMIDVKKEEGFQAILCELKCRRCIHGHVTLCHSAIAQTKTHQSYDQNVLCL